MTRMEGAAAGAADGGSESESEKEEEEEEETVEGRSVVAAAVLPVLGPALVQGREVRREKAAGMMKKQRKKRMGWEVPSIVLSVLCRLTGWGCWGWGVGGGGASAIHSSSCPLPPGKK